MDRHLSTPSTAALFDDREVPVWLICAADWPQPDALVLRKKGAEIISVPVDDQGMISPQSTLDTLVRRGITRVLIEGGPSIAEAFAAADLIDEAVIYQGPVPAGEGGLTAFGGKGLDRFTDSGQFTLTTIRNFGPDRMMHWRRMRACSPALSAA
jgi:diaminohydroxyphosphoribosylaminopyrimidine deaminase/5-amino-6-(5-phosphoribosylamino)uracil reductase